MSEGRGNLISQVERLKKLGSKTKKELDRTLVEQANLENDLDDNTNKLLDN